MHCLLPFSKWEVVDSIKYTQEVKGQERREEKRRGREGGLKILASPIIN
jgi:hypothetical protein